ncbi:hypothetical protein CsSME_00011255 [Camellia sinensis var. sinensis]
MEYIKKSHIESLFFVVYSFALKILLQNCLADISVIGDIKRREANCWANALAFEGDNIIDESFGWTLPDKLPILLEHSYY